MNETKQAKPRIGEGCRPFPSKYKPGYQEQKPSTPRGKRRAEKK